MVDLRTISVGVFGEEGDILVDPKIPPLLAASSILVTGSLLISPLIADLADVYGVSETASGQLIVSFTAAAALSLPVVGIFADRVGRKQVLTAGLLLFGVAGAAVGTVHRFRLALALRVCQGVGFACAAPLILTLFGDLYQDTRETTVQGMRVTANGLVNTAAPLLASVLFGYSWRYPFAIYLVAIPVAAWVWLAVPPTTGRTDGSFRVYISRMVAFLRTAQVAFLMASFMLRFVLFYGLITYISVLAIREAGLTVLAVGVLLSIRSVVKTLVSTQAGRLSLSYDPAVTSLVSFVTLGAGIALMGALPTGEMLAIGMALVGTSDGILSPSQKSLTNRITSREYRGGATSTAMMFQNVGKVVGPVGLGFVLNATNPVFTFVLLGIVGGGAGAGTLFVVMLGDREL